MLAMGGFVERANGAGLQTYLHGIPSISLIAAAIASGFEYIDGQPVTSLAEVSLEIQPFKLKDLYATLRDGV